MGYFTYDNEDDKMSTSMACFYASGVVFMAACYNITHHLYFFGVQYFGMRLRVAAGSLIYRKVRNHFAVINLQLTIKYHIF